MKIKLADGTEMEVVTPEENKIALEEVKSKAKAEALEEFNKLNVKEKEDKDSLKDLDKKDKKDEKPEEKLDISDLVTKEVGKIKSAESYKRFNEKIGKVEGVDLSVFNGLNETQYEAILSLTDKKKTLSEEEFNKLVDEKATEKAKKILEDNDKTKHEEPKIKFSDMKKY